MEQDAGSDLPQERRAQVRFEPESFAAQPPMRTSGEDGRAASSAAAVTIPPPPSPPVPPTSADSTRTARRHRREHDSTPPGGCRCFCPVPNCPAADATRSPGWTSVASMRNHLEGHRTGQLQGSIPPSWLDQQRLMPCPICDRLLVGAPGAVHPRCRPAQRLQVSQAARASQAAKLLLTPGHRE